MSLPVYLILEKLTAGETSDDNLAAYPRLTKDHIAAALKYAAGLASNEVFVAS